jgi:hypothetical protein
MTRPSSTSPASRECAAVEIVGTGRSAQALALRSFLSRNTIGSDPGNGTTDCESVILYCSSRYRSGKTGAGSMGTWGVGAFANDTAGDWSYEFKGADLQAGLTLIRDALNGDEDELAVAAAEMVAAINGQPASPLPDPDATDDEDEEEDDDELDDADVVIYVASSEMVGDPEQVRRAQEVQALFNRPDPVIAWRVSPGDGDTDNEGMDDGGIDDEEGDSRYAMVWVARNRPASDQHLTELARRAVARVTSPDSWIASLWDELDDSGGWREYMAGLAARLAG